MTNFQKLEKSRKQSYIEHTEKNTTLPIPSFYSGKTHGSYTTLDEDLVSGNLCFEELVDTDPLREYTYSFGRSSEVLENNTQNNKLLPVSHRCFISILDNGHITPTKYKLLIHHFKFVQGHKEEKEKNQCT